MCSKIYKYLIFYKISVQSFITEIEANMLSVSDLWTNYRNRYAV